MKCLFVVAISFLALITDAQIRIGIQGGIQQGKWFYREGASESSVHGTESSGIKNFQTSFLVDMDLTDNVILRSSLGISRKGSDIEHEYRFGASKRKIKCYYADLPVTLIYQHKLNALTVFGGGGLYGSYGLWGEEDGEIQSGVPGVNRTTRELSNKIVFKTDSDMQFDPMSAEPITISRWDLGYNLMAGLEYRRVDFILSFSRGMKDIIPGGYYFTGNFKNQAIGVSLAYLIKK